MKPYLWMLAGCVSFSIMAALANQAGQVFAWQWVALLRALLVFVFVVVYALHAKQPLVFWRPYTLWMRSIAGSISLVASFYALTRLPISTVLTLTNTFPIWVAVLSWPMLGIIPPGRVWLAMLAGITGVWFIEQPEGEGPQFALMMALIASVATAIAMLGLHKLKGVNSSAVVVHFAMVATLFCIVTFFIFPLEERPLPWEHLHGTFLLLGIGITATVGQVFLTKAFAAGDPSRVSIIGLTQVVFALLIDMGQDRSFTTKTLLGMLLIVAPTAWVMRKGK